MTNYADVDDIASEFKDIVFNTSTSVDADEVSEFILQAENLINGTISNRYVTPANDLNSETILRFISVAFVAYRVAKIINLKKDVPIPEKFVPQMLNEGAAYRNAKKTLEEIRDGKLILYGAVAKSSGQGVKSHNADIGFLPFWERDVKQW